MRNCSYKFFNKCFYCINCDLSQLTLDLEDDLGTFNKDLRNNKRSLYRKKYVKIRVVLIEFYVIL